MTELPILHCELDAAGRRAQGDRYAAIGAGARRIEREGRRLVVALDDTVDPALVDEAVAVERGCCPFFELRHDAGRLEVSVADPAHEPALDAIEHALRLRPPAAGASPRARA
jgi:hypothetical protein